MCTVYLPVTDLIIPKVPDITITVEMTNCKMLNLFILFLCFEGKVCYQYEKDSSKQERMDYVEFIGRVASHGVRLCYSWKPSSNTLFLDAHSQ